MSGQADHRMTWAEFMRQAHERPLPREILDELAHLEDEKHDDDNREAPSDPC